MQTGNQGTRLRHLLPRVCICRDPNLRCRTNCSRFPKSPNGRRRELPQQPISVVKSIQELDFEEGPSISPAACRSSTVCGKTTLNMINRDPNERPTVWQLLETFPPRPCGKQGPVSLEPVFPRVPEEELDIILSLPPSPAILPTPHTSSCKRSLRSQTGDFRITRGGVSGALQPKA